MNLSRSFMEQCNGVLLCTGVPEPVQRIEIWLDDAHWWLTQKDGQLEIADISIANFRYTSYIILP